MRDPQRAAAMVEAALTSWAATALAMRDLAMSLGRPVHGLPAALGRLWVWDPDPRLHAVLSPLQSTASMVAGSLMVALAALPAHERRAAAWWWGIAQDPVPPASVEEVAARCGYSHPNLARYDLRRAWDMLFGADVPLPGELEWPRSAPAELAWMAPPQGKEAE